MKNEEIREKCSSLVLPHLDPILSVLDRLFTRYGLIIPLEFWLSIIFLVYTMMIFLTGASNTYLIFFGSLAFLLLFVSNWSLIKDIIRDRFEIGKMPATTRFLTDIETKKINEVQKFLSDYRYLNLDELKLIANSKFFSNPSVQLSIQKYQRIPGEFIEYVINHRIDELMNIIILRKYIYSAADDISKESFHVLLNKYSDKKLIKSLFVNFPLHSQSESLFFHLATFRLKIRDWFRYGSGDGLVGFIAIIITIFTMFNFVKTNTSLQSIYMEEFYWNFFYWVNIIMSSLILFGILFIFIKFIILLFLKFFKYVLYLTAPSSNL